MLFAVPLSRHGMDEPDRDRRLRTLRNLAESAFVDRKRMSEYVGTIERLVLQGTLEKAQAFNAEWTADEPEKWKLADAHPDVIPALHKLEDLTATRGRLFALELDADTIATRGDVFALLAEPPLRDSLGAALLTKADYSRDVGWNGTRRQLGSSTKDDSWRDLFTTGSRTSVARTRIPLMKLLDDVHARMQAPGVSPADALDGVRSQWLAERESRSHFDWRYYFVRYAGARSSVGEGYFHNERYNDDHGGFGYGRIWMLHGGSYIAYFSDALLRAAWVEGDLAHVAREPKGWHRDDPGMAMSQSSVEIRCLHDGFEVVVPADDDPAAALALKVLAHFPRAVGKRVRVEQAGPDEALVDVEDRMRVCIGLVRALHQAGL